MRRKYIFIAATLLCAVLFSACSKDENENNSGSDGAFIRARIGGQQTNLSVDAWAHQENSGAIAIVGFTTEPQQGKESTSLQLAIYNSAEKITARTYDMDANANYSVLVTFGTVKSDGSQVNFSASEGSASRYDIFSIKITSIDSKQVKGTFAGKVVQGTTTNAATIEISEGEFSVPIR